MVVLGGSAVSFEFARQLCSRRLRVECSAAEIRRQRPDSGLGLQIDILENFLVVPSALDSWTSTTLWNIDPPNLHPRIRALLEALEEPDQGRDASTSSGACDPRKALRTLNQKSFLEDFVNFWR